MKYHSFYMRLLCLILIIGAVLGYNFMQKNDTQALQITELTDRVSALEEQQKEMLTALEDAAKAQEEARAAAYNASQKTETSVLCAEIIELITPSPCERYAASSPGALVTCISVISSPESVT